MCNKCLSVFFTQTTTIPHNHIYNTGTRNGSPLIGANLAKKKHCRTTTVNRIVSRWKVLRTCFKVLCLYFYVKVYFCYLAYLNYHNKLTFNSLPKTIEVLHVVIGLKVIGRPFIVLYWQLFYLEQICFTYHIPIGTECRTFIVLGRISFFSSVASLKCNMLPMNTWSLLSPITA